jgi:hypothetical protein
LFRTKKNKAIPRRRQPTMLNTISQSNDGFSPSTTALTPSGVPLSERSGQQDFIDHGAYLTYRLIHVIGERRKMRVKFLG